MIETVMFFALGFLVASLCALLFLPVIEKRANRLARRRVEALFPLSLGEIAAERDALRAEIAVARRRMERKVETAQTQRHAEMAAAGARTLEIAALAREVETRDTSLGERRAEIAHATARIADLDRDLTEARTGMATGLATLEALEEAHREMLDDLKILRRERGVGNGAGLALAETGETGYVGQENAELRQRIVEVADALARREGSPRDAFVPVGATS